MNFIKKFSIRYIIATRKSFLAIVQTKIIINKLLKFYPYFNFYILGIETIYNNINNLEKNFFIKNLETAIIKYKADFAIHCLKDVPAILLSFLKLIIFLKREEFRDVFISNIYNSLKNLPLGSIIGTSSLRRQFFIKKYFPKLIVKTLNGNIDTRLYKLDSGKYDAIILAAAGLKRLKLFKRIKNFINLKQSLPASGQGTLTIEILNNRKDLYFILFPLNHNNTFLISKAERTFSKIFFNNCKTPISSLAIIINNIMNIRIMFNEVNNNLKIKVQTNGYAKFPKKLGIYAAFLFVKKIKKILL